MSRTETKYFIGEKIEEFLTVVSFNQYKINYEFI